MLITCQADHNEHAFNKTGRLTDWNFMTDYTVADYKLNKSDIALHSVWNAHPHVRASKLPPQTGNVTSPLLQSGHFPIALVRTSNLNVTGFQPSIILTEQLLPVDSSPDRESSLGCLRDPETLTDPRKTTKDRRHPLKPKLCSYAVLNRGDPKRDDTNKTRDP